MNEQVLDDAYLLRDEVTRLEREKQELQERLNGIAEIIERWSDTGLELPQVYRLAKGQPPLEES
jgi:hypothetical protein